MLIFLIGSESLSMLRCISNTCMLNSYVVHCDYGSFGWTINQIPFWGRKNLFNRLPDGQPHLFS